MKDTSSTLNTDNPPASPLKVLNTVASKKISPDYVRLSFASALALRLVSGRFARNFPFGGINLLLNYEQGCFSDCGYCGLARTRPGNYEEKSFIRVEWPLLETDQVVERMKKYQERLTRLCISMVTHGRAFQDTVDISERIVSHVKTPLSILVAPPTLNYERLKIFKDLGVDMIGVGLDAVTEEVFFQRRTNVPQGGLKWQNYWDIINYSREIFGPYKVNCHVLVGLGETDRDLVNIFYHLKNRQIYAYLFCFNPEPDSRMANHPKSSITRWRRIQLVKSLIEDYDLEPGAIGYDDAGNIVRLNVSSSRVMKVVNNGLPFMTNGCPAENGEPGCTRPYGSYRPSEAYRDYPFLPEASDMADILNQLKLNELIDN